MPTLLIIDLQESFNPDPDVIKNTFKHITQAVLNNWGVVVLEYEGHGLTHPHIRKALRSYPFAHTATKNDDGGANEFLEVAIKNQLPLDEIYVAGVNRGYCVLETVKSLIAQKYRVKVIEEATWSSHEPMMELMWLRDVGVEVV